MGVSVIVFSNNEETNVSRTIQRLKRVIQDLQIKDIEIILVDDGSSHPLGEIARVNGITVVRHSTRKGISDAILSGLQLSRFEYVMPTPGHDMYSELAFKNVLSLAGKAPLVIGCRVLNRNNRPPLKRLASRIFRDMYRHLTFSFVGDVHGLVIYEKDYLLKTTVSGGGHTFAMLAITKMLCEGNNLIQTLAPLNKNHRNRPESSLLSQAPRPSQVLKTFQCLFTLRSQYVQSKDVS